MTVSCRIYADVHFMHTNSTNSDALVQAPKAVPSSWRRLLSRRRLLIRHCHHPSLPSSFIPGLRVTPRRPRSTCSSILVTGSSTKIIFCTNNKSLIPVWFISSAESTSDFSSSTAYPSQILLKFYSDSNSSLPMTATSSSIDSPLLSFKTPMALLPQA